MSTDALTYARIYEGEVVEIIQPATYSSDSPKGVEPPWKAGDQIPISVRYTAEFVATCIDITEMDPQPADGWSAIYTSGEWTFTPPSLLHA